jgi:uncharacterized protein (UPF0332 family)
LSLPGAEGARKYLMLAEGLIRTTNISDVLSEYEIRNAFSRSYYAPFHASHGYLRAAEVNTEGLGKKHGRLHAEMERWLGRSFGQFVRNLYELRRKSDYEPDWQVPPGYWVFDRLKAARKQCYFLIVTAQKLIA